jgi:hypothetical protein
MLNINDRGMENIIKLKKNIEGPLPLKSSLRLQFQKALSDGTST